jgi:hypothetical protein
VKPGIQRVKWQLIGLEKTISQMTLKKALERWETKIALQLHLRLYGPLRNSSQRGMDQRRQLLFMVFKALNFNHYRNPTQLLTPWKISSHPMTCVTTTMNCGWWLEFKLCSKL